jgi:hypothetical protein
MWATTLLALLSSIVVTLVSARFTDGIGKLGRLARTSRELDIAERLPVGDPLREDLETIARHRVGRYVATERPHIRTRRRITAAVWGGALLGAIVIIAVFDLSWWVAILLGAAMGGLGVVADVFLEERIVARPFNRALMQSPGADGTPPPPPDQPSPTARPTDPDAPAQP